MGFGQTGMWCCGTEEERAAPEGARRGAGLGVLMAGRAALT